MAQSQEAVASSVDIGSQRTVCEADVKAVISDSHVAARDVFFGAGNGMRVVDILASSPRTCTSYILRQP